MMLRKAIDVPRAHTVGAAAREQPARRLTRGKALLVRLCAWGIRPDHLLHAVDRHTGAADHLEVLEAREHLAADAG